MIPHAQFLLQTFYYKFVDLSQLQVLNPNSNSNYRFNTYDIAEAM